MSKKLIEIRSGSRERAFLVTVDIKGPQVNGRFTVDEEKKELEALVLSTGCEIVGGAEVHLNKINPPLFIGRGKAEEIAASAWEQNARVIIFSINLSSAQQRNLEDITGAKTIDRTQLILDIFAQHAKSSAGKIQVELAQLDYLLPRLKGKGIMLSRLGGGIGTRGPGEKKLEVERRRIEERISRLKKELLQLRKHREVQRHKRKKEAIYSVSLVGYTNAGKTYLLNVLAQENQKTEEALFTTLDPLARIINLKEKVVISDTVGFIHNLPAKLLEAFKATLEELEYSDLLIHLIDISRGNFRKLISAVENILKGLNLKDKPTLFVFNKIDKADDDLVSSIERQYPGSLFISAKKGLGIDELKKKIEEKILKNFMEIKISLSYQNSDALSFVYKKSKVLNSEYSPDGKLRLNIRIRRDDFRRLERLI